jgi:N-carbamoylputrescine amidase
MNDIRIAVVIFHSAASKSRRNLDEMEKWITAAGKEGAALICFPEMNITGYGLDRDTIGAAESIPGLSTERLTAWAESENIVILAGMVEKEDKNRVFASHLVVNPDGCIGVYRKLHIAPPERSVFLPGNDIPLFETRGVRFGIQLCYDAHFPEISTRMAVEGADIIFLPHASPRGTPKEKYRSWMRHLPARAFDNGLFVVACNQTGENGKGLSFPGLALVIDPSGNVKESQTDGKEGMIVADLKGEDITRVRKHRMRYFLPNRRPEIYRGLS